MIQADQPKIFTSGLRVMLSSTSDGNMKRGLKEPDEAIYENNRKFLARHMVAMPSTVLCNVTYNQDDYTRYVVVRGKHKGAGMTPHTESVVADAIATDEKNVALFLPLADCAGAVLYDPARSNPRLMVAHFGRHSLEQSGVGKSVAFMKHAFGSKPENIFVWISPSPNGTDYPLWQRDGKSVRAVIAEDLSLAGITPDHIEISPVDTITNHNYFSHSEFLKGHRDSDGRHAIAAVIR